MGATVATATVAMATVATATVATATVAMAMVALSTVATAMVATATVAMAMVGLSTVATVSTLRLAAVTKIPSSVWAITAELLVVKPPLLTALKALLASKFLPVPPSWVSSVTYFFSNWD